jgi:hypothetical protein
MKATTDTAREFWREVLLAGRSTGVPRWVREPVAGIARHEVAVPDDDAAALHRLADDLALPLSSVLLAAHARVLTALAGESEVVTGYVAGPDGRALPCRLATDAGSWRELLQAAGAAESALLAPDTVLGVSVVRDGERLALQVRYRKDALDAAAAARIAGYHLTDCGC